MQAVVPRSVEEEHMADNLSAQSSLMLSYQEMQRVDALNGSQD